MYNFKISLITGPMGSGKSASLINMALRERHYGNHFMCFKPLKDTRSSEIQSRNGQHIECIKVTTFKDILKILKKEHTAPRIIFIDEIQFLEAFGIKQLVSFAYENNISIISSGLNLNSDMYPFRTTSLYLAYCTELHYMHGSCEVCGSEKSTFTKCNVIKEGEILIGDDIYSQTCFKCYHK